MATAFSAVCDDVSFIEFNPAGSSLLARTELAFFYHNWAAKTNIEGIVFATRFEKLGIGAGVKWLYSPFTEYNIYGESVSNGYYTEGVVALNASYNFLSGGSFSGLSVGMNLKGAFRTMPDWTDNWDMIIHDSGRSQSAMMVMGDIGFLTRFNMLKFFTAREQNASAAFVVRNIGSPSKGNALPAAVSAAVSYKPIRPLQIALDFTIPVNLTDISLSEKPSAALGFSANIAKFLKMQTGVLYKAGSSRWTAGSTIDLNRVAVEVNYTLDSLTRMRSFNRISLGVRLNLGDRGRQDNAERAEELYLLGLEAYSRENFADARICWEEALRLDPGFKPVIESLNMLDNRERLIKQIDDLYKLEF